MVSFDDAVRFFVALTQGGKCFACGTDNWNISTMEGNDNYCFFKAAGGKVQGVSIYNLEIECANCGLIRAHRADILEKWLSNNPSPAMSDRALENE